MKDGIGSSADKLSFIGCVFFDGLISKCTGRGVALLLKECLFIESKVTQKRDGLLLKQWDGSSRFLSGPETVALLCGYRTEDELKGACCDRA